MYQHMRESKETAAMHYYQLKKIISRQNIRKER
jgi:hypothetical protein